MSYDNRRRPYRNPASSVGNKESHVTVVPRENQHIEKAIRKFLRKVKKSGIINKVRNNSYYEKPSTKRRRKKKKREKVLKKLAESSER
tara:strand:+ start:1676 stop:1939 length:264 start_codon:yes stop_codon:yes gene_type:complete